MPGIEGMPSRIAVIRVGTAAMLIFMAVAILLQGACAPTPPAPPEPKPWWGTRPPKPVQLPDDPPPAPIAAGRFDEVMVPAHGPGTLCVLGPEGLMWFSDVAAETAPRPLQTIIPSADARRSGLNASTRCQIYIRPK